MKGITLKELADNIRNAIKSSRASLDENRARRKELMHMLRGSKENVRSREALASHVENAGIDPVLVRDDLATHRAQLADIRKQLLFADVYRNVELSKFRTLHAQLDKLGVPFNPNAQRGRRA